MLVLGIGTRGEHGLGQPGTLPQDNTQPYLVPLGGEKGDFSGLFFPTQLDRDSLRLPIVASSVGAGQDQSQTWTSCGWSLSSALGLLVGGARLLAPFQVTSSSAPPGRKGCVRITVLGCVWLWAGQACWVAHSPTLVSTRAGEAPGRTPACLLQRISSGQAPCAGTLLDGSGQGQGAAGEGPARLTLGRSRGGDLRTARDLPVLPLPQSPWLRPPLLRLWSWSGRRHREITKLNAAKTNKVPMQQAHG